MGFNIAIDGPAGAGKSTIAKMVAKRLNFIYVDTGAMYRALSLYLLRNQIAPEEEEAVAAVLDQIQVSLVYKNGEQVVLLNGENVNGHIRTEEVGIATSTSSAHAKVRNKLLQLQKELAATEDVVMDGRDIGSTVLPDADVKVYLTASVQTRAKRRFQELQRKEIPCVLEEIEADITKRDYQDMTREVSPLKQADGAVKIDSSDMTLEEVTNQLLALCQMENIGCKSTISNKL